MNVILCDDDPGFLNELKDVLLPIYKNEYPSAKIRWFFNGNDLLSWYTLEGNTIDILYIDVEMPGFNGIDVLKSLRNNGCKCYSVFISSYISYVETALDYDIVHYLVKPLNIKKVRDVTNKVILKYKKQHKCIELSSNNKHSLIEVHSIIYVESNFRSLIYHTTQGNYTVNGKISDIENKLIPYNFLRTHKSYLVNMDYVLNYEGYKFNLLDGMTADISHTKRSLIIGKYKQYLYDKLIN
ncbi:LytTR family DNA-binding domain-containing protein [Eubacterium sp. 1001713B170207_170306_E7]|uniref:LytR/AlgR family response regulator transcription factor n=1 Tax=Eubacterium sp. 1001713B170207_170306_E7 TaxID=2787097 RepID=UPI00189B1667|nr:LytTR family DNA-binding domain-containing protein [Eubacterium sp. 1001713B170207_170306_E7]